MTATPCLLISSPSSSLFLLRPLPPSPISISIKKENADSVCVLARTRTHNSHVIAPVYLQQRGGSPDTSTEKWSGPNLPEETQ